MQGIIITTIIAVTIVLLILIVVYASKYEKEWNCNHDWKTYAETEVHDDFEGTEHRVIFICKKCGKIKKMEL